MQQKKPGIPHVATVIRISRGIAGLLSAKPAPRAISQSYFTTKSLMRLHGAFGFVLTNLLQIVDQFIDIVVLL